VIDNLRGFSVLLVFLFHIYLIWNNSLLFVFKQTPVFNAFGAWCLKWGTYGVDLFFTLSGFLIAQSLARNYDVKEFYLKRFARIFPIYYTVVIFNTFVFCLLSLTPMPTDAAEAATRLTISGWNAANTPYFLAFLASYRPHFGPDFAGHLWSLAVEEHFYMMFPLLLFVFRKRIAMSCVVIFFLLLAWRGYVCYFAPEVTYDRLYHTTHTRIMGIFLGAILFYYRDFLKGWRVAIPCLLAAGFFYSNFEGLRPSETYLRESVSFAMMTSEFLKHIFPSLAIVLIVANFHQLSFQGQRWLSPNEKLGKASLSFYVWGFIANCFASLVMTAQKSQNFFLYLIFVTALTLALSIGSYFFFEKFLFQKIVQFGRRWTQKSDPSTSEPTDSVPKAS
jgi:peptidoglycan/LPS O-acetylase OafA/YrhL